MNQNIKIEIIIQFINLKTEIVMQNQWSIYWYDDVEYIYYMSRIYMLMLMFQVYVMINLSSSLKFALKSKTPIYLQW